MAAIVRRFLPSTCGGWWAIVLASYYKASSSTVEGERCTKRECHHTAVYNTYFAYDIKK